MPPSAPGPVLQPGATDVGVAPNCTEQAEAGGVNWTTVGGVNDKTQPLELAVAVASMAVVSVLLLIWAKRQGWM